MTLPVKPKASASYQTCYVFKEMPQEEGGGGAASFLFINKKHLIILLSLSFLSCKMGSYHRPYRVLLRG